MSNSQHIEPLQTITPQAPAAMRELTLQEMLAVVGGPEIKNGGIGIIATPPTPTPGS